MNIKELQKKEFQEDLNTIAMELERIKGILTQLLKDNNNDEAIRFYNLKMCEYYNSKEKVKNFIEKLHDEILEEDKIKLGGGIINDKFANEKQGE